MSSSRSPLYTISAALLPASFALYLVSLTMYVAQSVQTVQIFGVAKSTTESFRLLKTIHTLYEDGQVGLSVIITAFTIVFPIGKYFALGYVMLTRRVRARDRVLSWVKNLGQWSMGDVFVVAFLVVLVRINSSIAQIHVEPLAGLWVFTASVLTSMVVSALLGLHYDGRGSSAERSEKGTEQGAPSA